MNYDALEVTVTKNTKIIIPVEIGGISYDYDWIFSIADRKEFL